MNHIKALGVSLARAASAGFQHNKAWILPLLGSAAYAAGSSLHEGKLDPKAIAAAVLVTGGVLAKSPLSPPVTKTDGQLSPD